MVVNSPRPCYILVGPEDKARLREIEAGLAPRLDYRLVAESLNATIVECAPPPTALQGGKTTRMLRSLASNFRAAARLARSIPDGSTIYSTGETWGLPASLAFKLLGKPCVHVIYAHRVYSSAWARLLRRLRGFMRVDGWICVTNHQAVLLRQLLGRAAPPVIAVSQGVDTRYFDPETANPEQVPGYILSVGAEMRDYPLLLEAVRDLPVETVIQASSAWMTTLRGSLQRLPSNVTPRSERLTYGELRDLYRNALLVVVPLHDTPQAAGITTILEAMSMRRCVIATRSRGLPDILIPDQTGAISEPSAAALAASISTLSASPQRREALAETGRDAVVAAVSIEEHARQVTDFIISTREKKSK